MLRRLYPYLPYKYVGTAWVPLSAIVTLFTVALSFARSGQSQLAMVFWVVCILVLTGMHLKYEYESTKRVRRLAELQARTQEAASAATADS